MGPALIGPGVLLAFQSYPRIFQTIGRGSALLGIGYASVQVQLGNYSGVVHLAQSVSFRLRELRRCLGLPIVGARFLESILGRLLILDQGLLFRGNLFF